jgi:3-mercaptopyruvate sulfurtransferase SseA
MANRTQRSLWPVVLIVAGFVLVAVAGLIVANLRQPAATVSGPGALTEVPFPAVQRVSVEDARRAHEGGSAVFVDVRDPGSYEQAHIPGALSIPLEELADGQEELDPDDWIITYCT